MPCRTGNTCHFVPDTDLWSLSQYAEQYFMDVKRTNWYPGFMGTTNNLVRKEHYRTFVKLFMDARGKGNRVKVTKCFSRLIRQLWSSDSYVDHQDE